jgi:hypothetical protein
MKKDENYLIFGGDRAAAWLGRDQTTALQQHIG